MRPGGETDDAVEENVQSTGCQTAEPEGSGKGEWTGTLPCPLVKTFSSLPCKGSIRNFNLMMKSGWR